MFEITEVKFEFASYNTSFLPTFFCQYPFSFRYRLSFIQWLFTLCLILVPDTVLGPRYTKMDQDSVLL